MIGIFKELRFNEIVSSLKKAHNGETQRCHCLLLQSPISSHVLEKLCGVFFDHVYAGVTAAIGSRNNWRTEKDIGNG